MKRLNLILNDVRNCRECEQELPLGCRPIVSVDRRSRILIIGQAPGIKVHQSGKPWDDASGNRLRDWMGLTKDQFYDVRIVGIMPMGFCYPGTGKSGDLPPRKECAPLWHASILKELKSVQLTLVIGKFAQAAYLPGNVHSNLTKTVEAWRSFAPKQIPLPHPSPRNNRWLKANPWFSSELLPYLKRRVKSQI